MTGEEAKKKWCPMATDNSRDIEDPNNGNPSYIVEGPGKGKNWNVCIASDCMMWRWETKTSPIPVDTDTGHCGLGGE